jgi:hypothetical protein
MVRRAEGPTLLLAALATALQECGVTPGTELPRDCWDECVMVACGVGPGSLDNYMRQGKALGYWSSNPKHGKGGRGTVTFLGLDHDGAVPIS